MHTHATQVLFVLNQRAVYTTIHPMNQSMENETTPRSRPRTHSMIYATPSSVCLIYTKYPLTAREKERVDRADAPFNQRRCLIENYPNEYSIQYCHMIARKHTRDEDLMASLEWYWNMRYGALHLNTRNNIFFAGAALHLHHDNNAWGLLPDKEYIDQYYEKRFADRNEFPQVPLPEGGFKYKLIPLSDSMRTFPILRQNEHGQPPNKDQYTIYFYPFDDMPTFRTHLHPKFAIYELGRKVHALVAKDGAVATRAFRTYQDLEHVYDVFTSWSVSQKNSARFEEWKNQDNTEGDGDGQSESSSKTGVDSWRNGVKRRRTEHADEQGSPTPAGRNSDVMQMGDLSCKSLSQETMFEHERFYGKEGWTQESLSGWIADASKHVTAHV